MRPEDTRWVFEDIPEYEEEERIAIQQEGCNETIDVVRRYPITEKKDERDA